MKKIENVKKNFNYKKLVDEEKIRNSELGNKSRLSDISKNILMRCKYIRNKSEFNDSQLKSRDGKLMQTNGLSVSDFSKKYNF